MAQHTPKPWIAVSVTGEPAFVCRHHPSRNKADEWNETTRDKIAEVSRRDTPGERTANACLIAAAPDLLEVCKLIFDVLEGPSSTIYVGPKTWAKLRDAIAKATGEAEGEDDET